MDTVGPALAAIGFIAIMSRVREPLRLRLNAVLVAGAAGVYLSGGFGLWELAFPAAATPVLLRAQVSYRFVALGWLMHSAWDLAHHLWGSPIWPFMPTSSWGCLVFDALIAAWFLATRRPSGKGLGKATTAPP